MSDQPCSFCGLTKHQGVRLVIASSDTGAALCNRCLEMAKNVDEEMQQAREGTT